MKKFRLLIVDDEPLIRSGIRDGLTAISDIEVAGEFGSVSEAVGVLRSGGVDLVFLDVELPDGKGFDVIRRVGLERMPAVVFVTAYDKYAIQAFEVNAIDYLLKPFDQSRMVASIDRVRGRLAAPVDTLAQRLETLLQVRETQFPQTLAVRQGDRFDLISVMSVDWIEDPEGSTRQCENPGVGALPFWSGTTVICCSNAHLARHRRTFGESSRRGAFRQANRKLKQDPLSLLRLMR